jgi:hypothetical protein
VLVARPPIISGSTEAFVSYRTIAAALALDGVTAGERLVAFSLASFADGEHQAFPGDAATAARAGLSRSRYLAARKQLVGRGLVTVADIGGGRGRLSTLTLDFANSGPWVDGRINPGLFQAVLSYSRARGPARLLLAGLGALANEDREVVGFTTEEIRVAAGLADSTYRRARAALLSAGEVVVDGCSGGRGNTNEWRLIDPRTLGPSLPARMRVAPTPGARPLMAPAREIPSAEVERRDERTAQDRTVSERNPAQDRTVSGVNPAQDRTVSGPNPGQDGTVSELNPGQDRTVSELNPGQDRTVSSETPPQTPPETPPPNARAGREPGNQRTNPPSPPEGGSSSLVTIVEQHVTERGRKRPRVVTVDLNELRGRLGDPTGRDQADWIAIRTRVADRVPVHIFEIWLADLELIAVDDGGFLLLGCHAQTRSWLEGRFGPLLQATASIVARRLRLASEAEAKAISGFPAPAPRPGPWSSAAALTYQLPRDQQEAS